ncbi:hypothetical protein G4Z16_20210 [Streptomyces bathyalis]|uniref:Uncharacterized protein n=1 Tax=Streptomyces bathyalis TaxID=2710756 RepID=A0A7T1WUW3_9ACTN|nr:hypothetical protein [Streptomyces bathyalis]QPP08335.1 hypothetical protein G4Z16_20210 [Streptomyces bathyalis]
MSSGRLARVQREDGQLSQQCWIRRLVDLVFRTIELLETVPFGAELRPSCVDVPDEVCVRLVHALEVAHETLPTMLTESQPRFEALDAHCKVIGVDTWDN